MKLCVCVYVSVCVCVCVLRALQWRRDTQLTNRPLVLAEFSLPPTSSVSVSSVFY